VLTASLELITCVSYVEARNRYRLDVCPSVCLSVLPSVTRWYCIKTAERIVMISSPHDSPFILVLCVSRSSRNSDGQHLPRLSQGRTQGKPKCAKMANFQTSGLNYWETVQDRWIHAARRLTSIEFSFDPCNIYRDCPRGVGYPADARSVGDSHPSCINRISDQMAYKICSSKTSS